VEEPFEHVLEVEGGLVVIAGADGGVDGEVRDGGLAEDASKGGDHQQGVAVGKVVANTIGIAIDEGAELGADEGIIGHGKEGLRLVAQGASHGGDGGLVALEQCGGDGVTDAGFGLIGQGVDEIGKGVLGGLDAAVAEQ